MTKGKYRSLFRHHPGQSTIEFALILPLLVLVVVGIFDLGRAFFAYIAISNAAREGVRIYTFTPDDTTLDQIYATVYTEIGDSTLVDPAKVADIVVECPGYVPVTSDLDLDNCPHGQPVKVTVTYTFDSIVSGFFSQSLTLKRAAEMMKP